MLRRQKLPSWAYFWPGLPQLWKRGSWVGLAVAVGFTTLVDTLLLASFVYHDWIPAEQQLVGLGLLGGIWLTACWWNRSELRREAARLTSDSNGVEVDGEEGSFASKAQAGEQWYQQSQRAYLQGDWLAAEQLLLKLLKQDAGDGESRLLLATMWRRQGRTSEARRQLDKLARLEAAEKWEYEIASEREQIAAAEQQPEQALRIAPIEPSEETINNEPTIHNQTQSESDRPLAA